MEVIQVRSSKSAGILRSLRLFSERDDISKSIEELEHDVAVKFEDLLEEHCKERRSSQQSSAIFTFFKPVRCILFNMLGGTLCASLCGIWQHCASPSRLHATQKPQPNSLSGLVKQRARARKEQLKQELSDDGPLRQIGYLVEEYGIVQPDDRDEVRINYDGFTQVATRCREMFGPSLSCLFKASVFQMFDQDADGCISARHFLIYLSLRSAMIQMRVHLSKFDPNNTGMLTEEQLEEFLEHFARTVPALEETPESFMPLYKKIAARKLLFFHGHNGSIRIKDLLSSHTLGELSDLKIPNQTEDQMLGTWFSLQSTMRVHNTFLRLDEFGRGMLNIQEFSQISGNTMSPLFLQRIFEEHVVTRRGIKGARDKMDLLDFTDFVLAWDHRSSPAAIKYFFPIFDLQKTGRITPLELYTFFKEIHIMWVTVLGEYPDLAIYDVVDELLDMIKPKNPPVITQEDLRVSGMSGIFFSILADAKQFKDYNYRENTMHQDEDQ